jgi:hypothetical protein
MARKRYLESNTQGTYKQLCINIASGNMAHYYIPTDVIISQRLMKPIDVISCILQLLLHITPM